VNEADYHQPPASSVSHDDLARLAVGVIRVVEDASQRVAEDTDRLLERDAMLVSVGAAFIGSHSKLTSIGHAPSDHGAFRCVAWSR